MRHIIDVVNDSIRYDIDNLDLTDRYSFDDCKRVVFRGGSYAHNVHGIDYLWLTPENKIKAYRAQYGYEYTAVPYWDTLTLYCAKSSIVRNARYQGITLTNSAVDLIKDYCY